jgi:selenide,water dikinase
MIAAARQYVERGIAPGGTHANRRFLAKWVNYDPDVSEADQILLCDAQTSGGLLAAVSGDRAPEVVQELQAQGARRATIVGSIEPGERGRISVRRAPQSGRLEIH